MCEDATEMETRGHEASMPGQDSRCCWRPHVIVGCCLADLLPPASLMRALRRLADGGDGGGGMGEEERGGGGGVDRGGGRKDGESIVYLPITFVGKTEMSPAAPQARVLYLMYCCCCCCCVVKICVCV